MADPAGHPRDDLTGPFAQPEAMGFFELLRRLETPGRRFGRAGGAGSEPARIGQRVRLSVATRDVAGFRPAEGDQPARVEAEVLGLLGPEGALPLHVTRWVMSRMSDRWFADAGAEATADRTFLDFCNMLQHRMLALYWRAWADARPEVQAQLGTGGRAAATVAALAGTGLPGTGEAARDSALKTRHATSLAASVHGPERLTRLLSDLVGAPVRLVEFVGHWLEVPRALQTWLGGAHAMLGAGAVVGARVFSRQGRAELRVGPLGLAGYLRLLNDQHLRARLRHAIRFAEGIETDFDLRLVLRRADKPEPRLGRCQLGRTFWLPARTATDADDLRLSAFNAGADRRAA
ncbi:hypothetical protein DEA8626_02238 [Defluviimonas aquaemixtae]|uniref:Type VI secretion system baseplate subunit TssG n=1 Tax=Albidovulum aquaemixtae TaxID=1542388 RepID=A0A2R8B801_9RHOB|nr:type VI secretion system baseplate subunit TssG [Defluviimonas aquaemixtae]SPH18696.1 hypothetical protein DEA8626_02238 [Defluviimonas aquaemixtae]